MYVAMSRQEARPGLMGGARGWRQRLGGERIGSPWCRAMALVGPLGCLLLLVACAGLPPEQPRALQWEAARECESRVYDIHVQDIDPDGRLHFVIGDAGLPDRDAFLACYQQRVHDTINALVSAGSLAPSTLALSRTAVRLTVTGNLLVVAVTLNGSQRAFLVLDTGAAKTILHPALVARLGVSIPPSAPRWAMRLIGGTTAPMPLARLQSLTIGRLTVEELDVGVYEAFPTAQGVEGLLGADVLHHFRVMIDRDAGRLTLVAIQPKATSPAAPGAGGDP
jgi:predicted aspartyl protease